MPLFGQAGSTRRVADPTRPETEYLVVYRLRGATFLAAKLSCDPGNTVLVDQTGAPADFAVPNQMNERFFRLAGRRIEDWEVETQAAFEGVKQIAQNEDDKTESLVNRILSAYPKYHGFAPALGAQRTCGAAYRPAIGKGTVHIPDRTGAGAEYFHVRQPANCDEKMNEFVVRRYVLCGREYSIYAGSDLASWVSDNYGVRFNDYQSYVPEFLMVVNGTVLPPSGKFAFGRDTYLGSLGSDFYRSEYDQDSPSLPLFGTSATKPHGTVRIPSCDSGTVLAAIVVMPAYEHEWPSLPKALEFRLNK
ncbi:MAG: hypothetical protein IT203_02515 [Fimbriimonadaceae bacterium]|nr:hypothetical protein [Fimbriimonadaceae bacterium]